jgi:hypothetical protein
MSGSYRDNNKITSAIKNNQILNYIYKKADNLHTDIGVNPNPSYIFPDKGAINNMNKKSYNDNIFEVGIPDYYNAVGTTMTTSKPLFNNEDNVLSDTINVGLNANVKTARIIGTSIY